LDQTRVSLKSDGALDAKPGKECPYQNAQEDIEGSMWIGTLREDFEQDVECDREREGFQN
jgi:hypothetical protein